MFSLQVCTHDSIHWPTLGPVFADRKIANELGGAIYSDKGYFWVVATENGRLVGFSAVQIKGNVAIFRHAYVFPSHRGQGIYRAMQTEREMVARRNFVSSMTVTAAPSSALILARWGWTETGRRGKYVTMTKDVSNE